MGASQAYISFAKTLARSLGKSGQETILNEIFSPKICSSEMHVFLESMLKKKKS